MCEPNLYVRFINMMRAEIHGKIIEESDLPIIRARSEMLARDLGISCPDGPYIALLSDEPSIVYINPNLLLGGSGSLSESLLVDTVWKIQNEDIFS